jgi:hypothetical protein
MLAVGGLYLAAFPSKPHHQPPTHQPPFGQQDLLPHPLTMEKKASTNVRNNGKARKLIRWNRKHSMPFPTHWGFKN